ncbi:MAG: cell division protein SepF [Clostridiales bacterium]|nr:cell division protein SepF [Clostridiales bacterium]
MASGDFFGNLKDKVRSAYDGFFYDNSNKQSTRGGYAQPVVQTAAQQPGKRSQKIEEQGESNVVDFGTYQQQHQQFQPPYQPAPQQQVYPPQQFQGQANYQPPQQSRFQPQPPVQQPMQPQNYQPAPQEPVQQPPVNALISARVINARGMADCRSAITLLRNGDAVLIVLENINDQAEQRRLVDTLSGACYSLVATITKVSRFGVYLLAPQSMAVFADQITNQMNGMPARPMAPRGYQPQQGYPGYQPQQGQPGPMYYGAPQQQGFAQRVAAPEEAPKAFYAQPAPQAAPAPAFTAQPAGYGYSPDEAQAQ